MKTPHLPPESTRRHFLRLTTALGSGLLISSAFAADAATPPATAKKAPANPPALPPDKVREVVGQSHRSLAAVQALVEETPTLANACWDWGGGDFETALQAAAHTGQREIAEYLLSRQARFDVYAAAMLGQLELVQAVLAADPAKLAAVPGPHGFTLLHCAKQGGEKAKAVCDYLRSLGMPEQSKFPLPFRWPAGTGPL